MRIVARLMRWAQDTPLTRCTRNAVTEWTAFSALTLSVGRQEEHPACKNWVMRCWCGYLSGARCILFAYGRADARLSWKNSGVVVGGSSSVAVTEWLGCVTHGGRFNLIVAVMDDDIAETEPRIKMENNKQWLVVYSIAWAYKCRNWRI